MKRSKFTRTRFIRASFLAAVGWMFILQASLVTAGPVEPASVDDTMAPTDTINILKTVQTPDIPPRPDIVFLADTTASMTDALFNVQTNAASIMSDVDAGTSGIPFFAAAEYRDFGDTPVFAVNIGLTANQADVNTAIGTWNASGGGDVQEAQLNALNQIATGAVTFRENATPVIVWFGDASGHDPSGGITEAIATAALVAGEIQVIAIDVNTGFGDGLDNTGQATRISGATDGQFFPGATPEEVSDAILEGLSNLPITVVPAAVGCGPLIVTFAPDSQTVTSGDPVNFLETITVPGDSAHAGQTVNCTVEFRDDDGNLLVVDDGDPETNDDAIQDISIEIPLAIDLSPDTEVNELSEDNSHTVTAYVSSLVIALADKTVDFTVTGTNAATGTGETDANGETTFSYTVPMSCDSLGTDTIEGCTDRADLGADECDSVTKDWVDTTAPVAECVETVNPHGNNKPKAPGKGGQGQNQDGFYELLAEDNLGEGCAPLQLWVVDSGSLMEFGPYLVGTKVKYTEDIDATPEDKKMGGKSDNADAIDWHIIGTGDMLLYAVDQSGNTSDPMACLVPPPPK